MTAPEIVLTGADIFADGVVPGWAPAMAVSGGLISAVGLLGSAVSPAVIGFLRDATGNFSAGLFYVTALLAVSIVLVLIVTRPFARA